MFSSKVKLLVSGCAAAICVAQGSPAAAAPSDVGSDAAAEVLQSGSTSLPSAQANAETADEATEAPGSEIIVTATRRAEPLARVGVTVTALSAEELSVFDISQPSDLARVVTGFQAVESTTTGQPVFILRGVGFDAPSPGTTSPVGVYVDEVAYPFNYMVRGVVFDLERIEVLKGPQGTLYGRNTTGGLINFIPAKPTKDFSAGVTVGIANYESWEFGGFLSGPLTSTLGGRFAFDLTGREKGWQVSVTRPGDRLGETYRRSFRGILAWNPTDRLDVQLSGTYWKLQGEPQAPQAIEFIRPANQLTPAAAASLIPNPRNSRQADFTPITRQPQSNLTGLIRPEIDENNELRAVALRINFELSDALTLASLTSYNDFEYDYVRDAAGLQTESLTTTSNGRLRAFAQELRLLGEIGPLNWSVGGYYARDKTRENTIGFVDELSTIVGLRNAALGINAATGNRIPPDQIRTSFRNYGADGETSGRVRAFFGNAEYRFSELLKVTAGARYTKDTLKGSACAVDVEGNQLTLVNFIYPILTRNPSLVLQRNGCYTLKSDFSAFTRVEGTQTDDNLSFRISGDITPNDRTLFYLSFSRGYKSGNFPIFAASNETQLRPVRQEKLDAYEAGVKLSLADRRVQLNGSVYYYDYTDRQVFGREPDLIFGSLLRIVNIPRSEVYGAEAEVTARIGRTLTASASVGYLKTEVKEFVGFDVRSAQGIVTNFAGASLPYSPEWMLNGSLINDSPINDDYGLKTAVTLSYQTDTSSVLGNERGFEIEDYALVGAQVGLYSRNNRWELQGFVNNLFDKYYWRNVQKGNETLIRYSGMPRTFGARLIFKY